MADSEVGCLDDLTTRASGRFQDGRARLIAVRVDERP
jgi:hypothetical protein